MARSLSELGGDGAVMGLESPFWFCVYRADLAFNFHAEGGCMGACWNQKAVRDSETRETPTGTQPAGACVRAARLSFPAGRRTSPSATAFNARCSSRKKSAFGLLLGNHFHARRPGDGQNGDRASGGVRGLSYPAGAGLPATRAALSTFECEHMPLYSKPGQVQVTSPAS